MSSVEIVSIVSGGTIVGEHGTFRADVVIRDGRISGLVQDSSALAGERLDATGRYVFPGGGSANHLPVGTPSARAALHLAPAPGAGSGSGRRREAPF